MAPRAGRDFTFALPPSLGAGPVKDLARRFADVLYDAGFSTVVPMKSYAELEHALLEGEVDAAWGPPIVCARIESERGQVVLRAVRYGAVTYRSVLVCRSSDLLDLRSLGQPATPPLRAVWVDRWSMAGYLLPRHHLRTRGLDLAEVFEDERLLGSYAACFGELLDGEADVTASFANRRGLGYVELCGDRAFELRTLAYTDESPNDGIVLSPKLDPEVRRELVAGLQQLIAQPASLAVLASTFDVDGFDHPPPGTYAGLLALV